MIMRHLTSVADVWRALDEIDNGTAVTAAVDLHWGAPKEIEDKASLINELITEANARGATVVELDTARTGRFRLRNTLNRCAIYPEDRRDDNGHGGVREPLSPHPNSPTAGLEAELAPRTSDRNA